MLKRLLKVLPVLFLIALFSIKTVPDNKSIEQRNKTQGVALQTCYKTEERKYTKEDLELLAHLLMAEAGSDYICDEMIYGVGTVIMNRIDSPKFPNDLKSVIYQDGQYQCTWDGGIYKTPTERCYRIAREILQGKRTMPKNVIWQSEFNQGSGVYTQIQNMIFCYE